jgi:hypothetical protein
MAEFKVFYQKMRDQNQKAITIPQNPCPISYVINEIMKAEGLEVRPVLFDITYS